MHIKRSFGKGRSLIACALKRFEMGWWRSHASLSKRAPSTTRTSLRFRINDLRAAERNYRTRRRLTCAFSHHVWIQQVRRARDSPSGGAMAGALPGDRVRERIPHREPGVRQDSVAAGRGVGMVVPVLLCYRAWTRGLRQVPARLRQTDLAARLA
jgi:hypothetical protein